MGIIAWIVLGAIAGYLAGFLVKGDEGLGVIGHIVLGIVGALVGGFLAGVLFNSNPIDGPFDLSSIVVSVIGAILVVVVVGAVTGRGRVGRGRSDRTTARRLNTGSRDRPDGVSRRTDTVGPLATRTPGVALTRRSQDHG